MNPRPHGPEPCALPAALRLDWRVFTLSFCKWSNMWSNHFFRDFLMKLYRHNCQCFQGLSGISNIMTQNPVIWSRTKRATNCATPRFLFKRIHYNKYIWSCQTFLRLFYIFAAVFRFEKPPLDFLIIYRESFQFPLRQTVLNYSYPCNTHTLHPSMRHGT